MIQQLKCAPGFNSMRLIICATLLTVAFWGFSSPSMAENQVTLEGVIQGSSCVHYKEQCPVDEAHFAMERDFVLLVDDGSHYILSNLSRVTKARYVTRTVQITGKKEGHEIWVSELAVKNNDKFKTVWSWAEQQKQYKLGGG